MGSFALMFSSRLTLSLNLSSQIDVCVKLVCLWFALSLPIPRLSLAGPLWMVRGPAHGPWVDVVQLAATSWVPVFVTVTLSIFEELTLLFFIAAEMVLWSMLGQVGDFPKSTK